MLHTVQTQGNSMCNIRLSEFFRN